jgi:ATP-dependent RNA helicase SUPV3L1/SUV3
VGRIVAGAHILEPSVRVIADEQLTGSALELVQRRLDLWLGQHVKKLLGPLFDLEKGEGLEGLARGIAFQIAESLGVLDRTRVAEDVKSLSQEARGVLRKLGVRFGAYHLYLPGLVKPAPRALAAQLWVLKNGGTEDVKGLGDVPHFAASGRTSFVADPAVPKGLYRAAGFRVCGERAVRVDILERLADLIRPAVAYRPGVTPGDPPPGAADGDGFVITMAMTSLAGCSGDAFGSILRSLGYVMDRRPGPPITVPLLPKAPTEALKPAAPPSAESGQEDETPAETAPPAADDVVPPTVDTAAGLARQSELVAAALEGGALEAIEPLVIGAANPDAPAAPQAAAEASVAEPVAAPAEEPSEPAEAADPAETLEPVAESVAAAELQPAPEASVEAPTADETPAVETVASEPHGVDAAASDTNEAEVASAPAEPVMIEVWRPHRHTGANRRPADQGRRRRPGPNGAPAAGPAQPAGEGAPAQETAPTHERPQRYRDPKRTEVPERSGREHRSNRNDRQDRSHSKDGPRPAPHKNERPRSEKQPDPNSPYAKLAALKAQLEQDRK